MLVVPLRVTLPLVVIFKGVAIGQCALWTLTVGRSFMVTHWDGLSLMGSLTRFTHSSGWLAVLTGIHFQWFFVMLPTVWISRTGTHECNFACAQLYPFQTCRSICGIVVMVMSAIACQNLPLFKLMSSTCISQGNTNQLPHIYLQKPSQFNAYLCRVIASWVAENAVTIEYVVPQTVQLTAFAILKHP